MATKILANHQEMHIILLPVYLKSPQLKAMTLYPQKHKHTVIHAVNTTEMKQGQILSFEETATATAKAKANASASANAHRY